MEHITAESPKGAETVFAALFDALDLLAEHPGIGHLRQDLTDRPVKFWSVLGRYSIVYAEADPIRVYRIFGPGRNMAALLR